MFLCREEELSVLNSHYNSELLECAVIYGRRRIGKTALINEFCKDKPTIFYSALNSNGQDNLDSLSKSLHTFLHGESNSYPVYNSFDDLFSQITNILKDNKRIVFVIDELPYLVKSDKSILSRLQHLIDHDWANSKLFLILCGSSISFMENNVLSGKSPLFGRRTMQLCIKPLTYIDSAKFNPNLSNNDKAIMYGITGGIPHYINKLACRKSIKESLLSNLFDSSSYLYEEPYNLLKQELREPGTYNSIITAIAKGESKLNKIAKSAHIERDVCNRYIKTLMEIQIVNKIEPIVDKNKKKVQYVIDDNFFKFWYRFIPKNNNAIIMGTIKDIYDDVVGSYMSEYMGYIFEEMCKQYLMYHIKDLPFIPSNIGKWWGNSVDNKSAELDIVCLGPKASNKKESKQFIIASCKYTNEKVGEDELELIKKYSLSFASKDDKCYYYIFSKSGFKNSLLNKEKIGEVKLISLDDLYSK